MYTWVIVGFFPSGMRYERRASISKAKRTIVKICAFLNAVSQKIIDPENLIKLQNDVVQCLVGFELIFPPSFFNIMTHLLVHLVKEIDILGLVFLHNMFPFERFMGTQEMCS